MANISKRILSRAGLTFLIVSFAVVSATVAEDTASDRGSWSHQRGHATQGAVDQRAFTLGSAQQLMEISQEDDLASMAAGEVGTAAEAPTAQLLAFADPNAWRAAQVGPYLQQSGSSKSGGGGFGHWLKKRWYIPVLAAVVIAVAVDDDPDEFDDD